MPGGGSSWRALNEAFRSVLNETRGGAAFCAIADGQVVANLSGGWANRAQTRRWRTDTTVTVFSGSKGLVSMCLALLVDRGQLDLDAPVGRYWPEFAAAGKGEITVRDVATHRAGLPALAVMPSVAELVDPARPTAMLAEQEPHPRLRGTPSYHVLTFGWLCGEIVRRVAGVSLGAFFRREIAEPAGADVRFGVPAKHQTRIAGSFAGATWAMPVAQFEPDYTKRIVGESELWIGDDLAWNRSAVRAAEVPGAGAIGTAEAMARCYAAFAEGRDGRPALVSSETLACFTAEQYEATDPCSGAPLRYGVGFQLQTTPHFFFGPPRDAFGHGGAGGSSHGWWPSERVAVSFAMNEMREETEDRRARELLRVLRDCLGG